MFRAAACRRACACRRGVPPPPHIACCRRLPAIQAVVARPPGRCPNSPLGPSVAEQAPRPQEAPPRDAASPEVRVAWGGGGPSRRASRRRRPRFCGYLVWYLIWNFPIGSRDHGTPGLSVSRLLENLAGPAGVGDGVAMGVAVGQPTCSARAPLTVGPLCPCSPQVPPFLGGLSTRVGLRVSRQPGWGGVAWGCGGGGEGGSQVACSRAAPCFRPRSPRLRTPKYVALTIRDAAVLPRRAGTAHHATR